MVLGLVWVVLYAGVLLFWWVVFAVFSCFDGGVSDLWIVVWYLQFGLLVLVPSVRGLTFVAFLLGGFGGNLVLCGFDDDVRW